MHSWMIWTFDVTSFLVRGVDREPAGPSTMRGFVVLDPEVASPAISLEGSFENRRDWSDVPWSCTWNGRVGTRVSTSEGTHLLHGLGRRDRWGRAPPPLPRAVPNGRRPRALLQRGLRRVGALRGQRAPVPLARERLAVVRDVTAGRILDHPAVVKGALRGIEIGVRPDGAELIAPRT